MNSADSGALPQPDEIALRRLGKMYRFSQIRYLLLLLIPALWLLGGFLVSLGRMDGLAAGILIGWFFVVLFGVGAWVFLLIPEKEELKRKYVSHVLPFLFSGEGINVEYYPSHDLQMRTFLQSGLFHDDYQTMLREDCIQGSMIKMQFSMYQVAVQTVSRMYGRYGNSVRSATNQFYGWAIHCIIPSVRGTHVILPRGRKTSDESDDWLENVIESWWKNPKCTATATGYEPFDRFFIVFSDNPEALFGTLNKDYMDFLVYLITTAENAFAINVRSNIFAMHIGHITPTFRHCPAGDFTTEYDPQLLTEVKWYADLIKGIQKHSYRGK